MKKLRLIPDEMNIDTFGEIMDRFIEENEVSMLITMPEGTHEPIIKSNMENAGHVMHLYFLLAATESTIDGMVKQFKDRGLNDFDKEGFVNDTLDIIRRGLLEEDDAPAADSNVLKMRRQRDYS